MDQNNTDGSTSPWGGDCDVGFDQARARSFLNTLREAKRICESGPRMGWESIEPVKYSWCDRDDEAPSDTEGSGYLAIHARRGLVRLFVCPKGDVEPYSFTLSEDAAERLIRLVEVALRD